MRPLLVIATGRNHDPETWQKLPFLQNGRLMSLNVTSKEGSILSRVLRPEKGDLPRETAEWLLGVDFDPADRARISSLYERAREGTLSDEEDAELDDYGDVGRMLEMLRAKARVSLARNVCG